MGEGGSRWVPDVGGPDPETLTPEVKETVDDSNGGAGLLYFHNKSLREEKGTYTLPCPRGGKEGEGKGTTEKLQRSLRFSSRLGFTLGPETDLPIPVHRI